MDAMETIDGIFNELLRKLMKSGITKHEIEVLLTDAKKSVIIASASNPLNSPYLLGLLTPNEYMFTNEKPI